MQLLSLGAMLSFSLAAWIVSLRLIRLRRRTHGTPELAMAGVMLGIGGVGYPLLMLGNVAAVRGWSSAAILMALGILSINTGIVSNYVFTWKVFRPTSGWAKGCTWAVTLILGVISVGVWFAAFRSGGSMEITPESKLFSLLNFAISSAAFIWSGSEALRYWGMLKRRMGLGLADPVVTNRFFVWGCQGLCSSVINFTNIAALLRDVNITIDPTVMFVTGLCGIANAMLVTLAFVPPDFYLRFLRGSTPQKES
jgi:hypothetical protein